MFRHVTRNLNSAILKRHQSQYGRSGWKNAFGAIGAVAALGMGWYLYSSRGHGSPTHSTREVPGNPTSLKTEALSVGSKVMQSFTPLRAIDTHACAFHFYSDDMTTQVEAHHYCSCLNQDFRQCVIYDSDEKNAKLIGVEYMISEKLFKQLPPEEKRLWHSHIYEVKSGLLIAPSVTAGAEKAVMKDLVKTYGKTYHLWQPEKHSLPLGEPKLMWSFTEDGQVNPDQVEARDKRMGISTSQKRREREDIPASKKVEGADCWETGESLTFKTEATKLRRLERQRLPTT